MALKEIERVKDAVSGPETSTSATSASRWSVGAGASGSEPPDNSALGPVFLGNV